MSNVQVIDNFLPHGEFLLLKEKIDNTYSNFPWFFKHTVGDYKDESDTYFTHVFYQDNMINSDAYSILGPILNFLDCKALIRARANLYMGKKELIHHARHSDFPFEHKAFILYINSNNGLTEFEDGTKVESVANRAIIFDGSTLHNSTNCTDEPFRMNISLNYF
jgi:hypothetical protein